MKYMKKIMYEFLHCIFSYIYLYQHIIRFFHIKTNRKILNRLNTLPEGATTSHSI
jgi:hypothetical protein